MSEIFKPEMAGSKEGEVSFEEHLANQFRNENVPLKVRKTELLEEVRLPIPKTDMFRPENVDSLREAIIARKSEDATTSLIIRFACVPDRFSMPTIAVEPSTDVDQVLESVSSLLKIYREIKQIILQELTATADAKDKISGRLLFEDSRSYPNEEVMELYKGSRSTGVLNNVDVNDPNFFIFEKKLGHFMLPNKGLDPESSIKSSELEDIYRKLVEYRSKLELIRTVIASSRGSKAEDLAISFEFSYLRGRLLFSDID